MTKTLFWYIFGSLLRAFLMTAAALAGMMSFAVLLRPLTEHGLDFAQVNRLLLYSLPPVCASCGGMERPGVVWFGEYLPPGVMDAATEATQRCEVLVVVGTSAVVYPAAGLVEIAAGSGAKVIEVNPDASAKAHLAEVNLRGPAGELLPNVDALLEGA